MGFDLMAVINSIIDNLQNSSILHNPFSVALLITISVVLIVAWVFRAEDITDGFRLSIRVGLYTFLGAITIIFLHNRLVINEYEKKISPTEVFKTDLTGLDELGNINIV